MNTLWFSLCLELSFFCITDGYPGAKAANQTLVQAIDGCQQAGKRVNPHDLYTTVGGCRSNLFSQGIQIWADAEHFRIDKTNYSTRRTEYWRTGEAIADGGPPTKLC